jgi:hypothetical protein
VLRGGRGNDNYQGGTGFDRCSGKGRGCNA